MFQLCQTLTEEDVAKTFKTSKQHDANAEKIEGADDTFDQMVEHNHAFTGVMGTKHTVLNEEQAAFADWINNNMDKDKDVTHKLKLNVRRKVVRLAVHSTLLFPGHWV